MNKYKSTPTLINFQHMKSFILTRLRLGNSLNVDYSIKISSKSILTKYLIENLLHEFFLLKNPGIDQMVGKIIHKEKELSENFYTFVHGQKREYVPYEQLHNYLYNLYNSTDNNDFLHLHVRENISNLSNEKEKRKRLLASGRIQKPRSTEIDKEYRMLLFTNWAYLANTSAWGSSSANYIAKNKNEVGIDLDYDIVFQIFGIKHLYERYIKELKDLHKSFMDLSEQGTCLLVAIPKATIHKQMYVAGLGGTKKTVRIDGIGETQDIRLIMDTLINDPKKVDEIDDIEFCIPMTYDKNGGLNPASGIKVFLFDSSDQQKFKEWEQRRDVLFARIAQDIKKHQNQDELLQTLFNPMHI